MAKSKSRRARRQQGASKPEIQVAPPAPVTVAQRVEAISTSTKGTNFAEEYFYVYADMRNVLIVTAVMLVVLFSLSMVI